MLGELAVRYGERHVTVGGRAVTLTATEFKLLRALTVNTGKVSTYEYLLRRVWSGKDKADRRLLRTYVKRLRQKLGDDAANPTYIVNQRQVGYRMGQPAD